MSAAAMDWSKLKPRERMALMALAGFLFLGVYAKAVQQPMAGSIARSKTQIRKAQQQLDDLKQKTPQDTEVAQKVGALAGEEKRLAEEIDALEKKIPSRFNAAQLVGEFTRLARDVKLESIKQRIVKDAGYSRIFLEVKFYSTYADAIRYLASAESISPFLKVEEMEILEPKGKAAELGGSPVRLIVSCLLSDDPGGEPLQAVEAPQPSLRRDILASSARPAEVLKESKLTLEGVTYDERNPTAIISGDVYAVGSEIAGYKVKQILPDTVVLSDGAQDHLLSLRTKETERKK